MNKLLQRQVSKFLGDVNSLPDDLRKFLDIIEESYEHFERDRKMLERSIEISSMEMKEINARLVTETEEGKREVYKQLQESLLLLNEDKEEVIPKDLDYRKLQNIAEILKQETQKRRQVEEELTNTNYELRTLFENMQECVFTIDAQAYQVIQISPSCEDIYGYSVEDFMNNSNLWIEVVPAEDRPAIWAKNEQLEKGESITNIYRIHDKQGNLKWLQTRIKPTLNEKGRLVRMDGVTSDITRQKEAEIALVNSEARFRSLIENSADAIMIVTETGEMAYASDSLYRIMGYTKEEVLNKPTSIFHHPDDAIPMQEHLERVLANPGQTFVIQYRRRKKDGDYIWCEGSATNLLHMPYINGIVVNFRDITSRKESELALRHTNEELKKSNSELDRFVYSVSHDLRAPLSSMLGVVSLIESENTNTDVMHDLELLKKNINKLDGFISDILDYSRNSRSSVTTEEIDFEEQLEYISDNLKYMASDGSVVEIRSHINSAAPFFSDKTRITIILNNLISNAIRYSDPSKNDSYVEVQIEINNDTARLVVNDNGIGITPENQQKVFDMFYRVSKRSVGSGLGLYLVKETVDKLNGRIMLTSEPGVGSSFAIVLPNLIPQ